VGLCIMIAIFAVGGMLSAALGALLGPGIAATILGQVIGVAMGTAVGPLKLAILVSMYYDLKIRKEGTDLADRVSALAAP